MSFEKVHAIVLIESNGRNENTSVSPTDFIFQLTQPINFFKRSAIKQYFVRLECIRIPVSFYNINANYDTFGWTGSATGVVTFNVTNGNYTIDELIAEVQVQMNLLDTNTYTITYDEITQKVNIASDGVENVSTLVGDGWQTLGFDLSETITGASNTDGVGVAYTNTQRYMNILLNNVNSNNAYSNDESTKQTNVQKVGVNVPVTQTRNEFESFNNHDGFKIKMTNMSSINEFRIKLQDPLGNTVDLNGVPWGFSIVFYEINLCGYKTR